MSVLVTSPAGGTIVPGRKLLLTRLALAVLQSTVLLWLVVSAGVRSWPASAPVVFEPMLLAVVYLPVLAMLGRSERSARFLLPWMAFAAIMVVGLGYHDAVRRPPIDAQLQEIGLPRIQLWVALSIGCFIAYTLVVDSAIEKRFRPSYPRHFDTAWKLGVQCCFALLFVVLFWGVLILGASLFRLVNIDLFKRLLLNPFFGFPATTLALAVSVHVTDVQPAMIRGARSLVLSLFSWLTPLLAVIILVFLSILPFVSLQPLWRTHFATRLLLSIAVSLIFLINCCYQHGAVEQTIPKPKRITATLAAIELVPLTALATWGLGLRVSQYGWSVARIMAAAVILVVACYAAGYASAVLRSPTWLKRLETTNWLTAYVVLAVILALFSPLADPARLMVADQMARLVSGSIRPDTFDFVALRLEGARWGAAALNDLRTGRFASDTAVQARIGQALSATIRYRSQQSNAAPVPDDLSHYVSVYPTGRTLPPSFLQPDFADRNGFNWLLCTVGGFGDRRCAARYVTLSPGAPEAIVLVVVFDTYVFEQGPQGEWRKTAIVNDPGRCLYQAVTSAPLSLEPHPLPDLVVDGRHLAILPFDPTFNSDPCGKKQKTGDVR